MIMYLHFLLLLNSDIKQAVGLLNIPVLAPAAHFTIWINLDPSKDKQSHAQ